MKILIANDMYWPMVGGPATVSRLLAQTLVKRGHEVLVVAPSHPGQPNNDRDGGYRIVRIKSISLEKLINRDNLRLAMPFRREIRGILRGFEPDVVHVHTPLPVGISTLREAHKLGIPVVATNHAMAENVVVNVPILKSLPVDRLGDYLFYQQAANLRLYKGMDYLIMPTQKAIDLFNQEKIDVPVKAVDNGLDLSRFKPGAAAASIYKRYELPRDVPVVSYLGRLDKDKHLGTILQAAPLIIAKVPNAHF
ncbi:glycosyltransferase, partial [Candidatus Saccharibacteria bacterium]|nr:glycosyltransferase [Candidatus Saccharibacteria bacterium]